MAVSDPQQTHEPNAENRVILTREIIYLKNLADTKITYLDCAGISD